MKSEKPLGRKNYGSIGHLPNSRLGEGDYSMNPGQTKIATEVTRDWKDIIIVQEKLDGSNCGVAKVDGRIVAISRAGYLAETSPFEMHHLFARWVSDNKNRFYKTLEEGERIVGEWLAQAHGTIYNLEHREPFAVFDIMVGDVRLPYTKFIERVGGRFDTPNLLHIGKPISVEQALEIHKVKNYGCDEIEGVVYRVERDNKVDFLAKYVRPDKVDGKYLPGLENSVTEEPIWNWGRE